MTATIVGRAQELSSQTVLARPGVDVSRIAHLAFARADPAALEEGRHLALLPTESLELDLTDPAQRLFGDYELLELIGEGGMGVVYRARQTSLDREVAIKLLAAGVWASAEFVERFRREAQNAARMQHPNIVPVYEVGANDELHYFSMRLIHGPSMAAELKREGRLAPQRAARLLRTVAEAVDYAHRLGVLHLDLKPANILIDENGVPHVADFGLARRLDTALIADTDEVSGTPSYMAPEQASPRTHRITPATDIWGLGAILYELVTGEPPFLGPSPQDTLKLVVGGALRNPRRYAPELPRDLEAIILKCMARSVAERYASARELAEDLTRFLEGRAVRARPLNSMQRALRWARREPKLAAATFAAFAALLIGLAATTQQWRRADSNALRAETAATTASEHLWDSRDASALSLMETGDGWKAASLLLANAGEMEAAGARDRAIAARKKLGILERSNPQLIDVIDLPTAVGALAFSPDGAQLAISSERTTRLDGTIQGALLQIYDLASGELRTFADLKFEGFDFPSFENMTFSPDGKLLMVAAAPGARMLPRPSGYDAQADIVAGSWRPPPALPGAGWMPNFSGDGGLAVLTSSLFQSQVWATVPWRASTPSRRLRVNSGLPVVFAIFAPDRHWFSATHHGALEFVDAVTLEEEPVTLPRDFGVVLAWAISPDSRWLVVSDHDGHALAIDHATRTLHALEPRPPFPVRWFAFSADTTRLAAAAGNGGVYMWQWPLGDLIVPPFAGSEAASRVAFEGQNERVLVDGGEHTASVWQIAAANAIDDRRDAVRLGDRIEVAAILESSGRSVPMPNAVAWQPGSGLLADSREGLRVSRLRPAALKHARSAPVKPTTLHFDGRRIVDVDGNVVRIVDALRETLVAGPFEFPQPPSFAQLGADGATLIVVSDRHVHVYDVTNGRLRFAPIELTNSPLHVEPSPDARRLATSWLDHGENRSGENIELWDLADGHRLAGPVRVPGPLDGLLFSASGRRLLASSPEYATLRDGGDLAAVPGPLADLRAPGFRGSYDVGIFLAAAFDGDDALLAVAEGGGRPEAPELVRAHLQRFDDGMRKQPAGLDWKSMLARPGTHEVLVAASDAPLVLHDRDGRAREFADSEETGAKRGHALAVSSDGRWLARSLQDGVELFDARDGKRVARLHAPVPQSDRVWQLSFSPDGSRVLGITLRNRTLVWDIEADGRPVAEIRRELELRAVASRSAAEPARMPAADSERAQLRARDPGAPQAPALRIENIARTLPSGTIAARSPQAPAATLDLTAAYNRALGEEVKPTMASPSDFTWLPRGVQRLLGIDFDIRGAIQLRAADGFVEKEQLDAPGSVTLAADGRNAGAIAALVLMNFPVDGDPNADAAVLVTLNYADRTRAQLPIRAGRDVQHWRRQSGLSDTARLATLGYDARILPEFWRRVRLYAVSVANPHPEKPLREIAFTAGKGMGAAPVLFAVTLQPMASDPATATR